MPYFDLHCHPTFKHSLSNETNRPTFDEPVVIKFRGIASAFRNLIMWVFGEPIDSQSCFKQILEGDSNLISHTIYSLENAYTRSSIISTLGCVSNTLDNEKIDRIRQGQLGYWPLADEQIKTLLKLQDDQTTIGNGRRLKVINDIVDYDPSDTGTLHVMLNFEGGHCFYTGQSNRDQSVEQDLLSNLRKIRAQGIRPLYITLVHHAQNVLANHAFAIPSQWAGAGTNNDGIGGFNPTEAAITPLGRAFINEALAGDGPPIYIDVKHMSLGSRLAYYELRNEHYPHIPIIASHVGVTGLSWKATHYQGKPIVRWVRNHPNFVEVKYNTLISFPKNIPVSGPENPIATPTSVVTFNPWSINLYDEDITEILASDGLIGLSLDVRILGMGNDAKVAHEHEAERLSKNEQLFSVQDHLQHGLNDFNQLPDNRIQASLDHIAYFCNNLLHIVRVGRQTIGERVWDHLCIGSDFDGLIVSIEFKNNHRVKANAIPELRKRIKQSLPEIARKMDMTLIVDGRDQDTFLEQILDKCFFDNALCFLKKYYTNPAQLPIDI